MSPIAVAELSGEQFFTGMPARMLSRLAMTARPVEFAADARIFQEGGGADRFWLISRGRVALDMHVPGRGSMIVETLGPGAVLGWSWLFPPFIWSLGARVVEGPISAIEFDARLVRTMGVADPALGLELHQRFSAVLLERLQATRMRLLDLYHVEGRTP